MGDLHEKRPCLSSFTYLVEFKIVPYGQKDDFSERIAAHPSPLRHINPNAVFLRRWKVRGRGLLKVFCIKYLYQKYNSRYKENIKIEVFKIYKR